MYFQILPEYAYSWQEVFQPCYTLWHIYYSAFKVKKQLVQNEIKVVEDIEFKIERQIKDNFIFKNIEFTDRNGSIRTYREQVQYIDLEKFKYFIAAAGLKIKNTFGNYQLEAFNQDHSDRLILEIV